MDRPKFLSLAVLAWAGVAAALTVGAAGDAGQGQAATPCRIRVVLPEAAREFPEPLPAGRTGPGFALRGTKGWGWTPEQYLAEIPFLASVRMNFLMNCYLSMFSDPVKMVNRWWEPIPEAKKSAYAEVVRACRAKGVTFCFAIHPQLFSERPLRYASEEDFRDLWRHFAWMQGLGVRWFSLSYDDIGVEGQDKARLGEAQAGLVNRLLARLREKDPQAEMIFCPVFYWGDGTEGDAAAYLGALSRSLDPRAFVFWTGDGVVTNGITIRAATSYKAAVGHRLVVWDNYPVNDRSGALHLGPLRGREAGLAGVAYGYMSNPHAPQNEINRLPLATSADFAWNPWAYDPGRSIGRAVLLLAGTRGQREALRDLVELYPGNLACGVPRTDYNSFVEEFLRRLSGPGGRAEAAAYVDLAEELARKLDREFPAAFGDAKATLRADIARLRGKLAGGPAR